MQSGLLAKQDSPFVRAAADLLCTSLKTVKDADKGLRDMLGYPLHETLATDDGIKFMRREVAEEIIAVSLRRVVPLPPVPHLLPVCVASLLDKATIVLVIKWPVMFQARICRWHSLYGILIRLSLFAF